MARPKSDDPAVQIAIYPRGSVWDRVKAVAAAKGEKPAVMVLRWMESGLRTEELIIRGAPGWNRPKEAEAK